MSNGFLGYPASFMLDVVVCALLIVVPLLAYSLFLAKVRKDYLQHRNLQLALGVILLIAVGLFEVDMRLQGGIEGILQKRPTPLTLDQQTFFDRLLAVHLVFAVSTVVLWVVTLVLAFRRMPSPPRPCPHSRIHKPLGWISSIDIALTAVTGLMVYYHGFMV